MNDKKVFEMFQGDGFIKTNKPAPLDSAQKVTLNRRGNELFNAGDVEGARRIFQTTGYSDGLVRVGDHYRAQGRKLDALKMYWIAPDRRKAAVLIEQLSSIIQDLLKE
jgi:hypothetical protein